jgi:hypothetical protein
VSTFWSIPACIPGTDGAPQQPLYGFAILFFAATTYISLDTAFLFTNAFRSDPPEALRNIALFILTSIWPAV